MIRFDREQKGQLQMKRHPGWLAAALLIFAVLACNAGKNGNNNNSNSNSNGNRSSNTSTSTATRPANAEVYVVDLHMAKDDDGKPGETTTTFAPSDSTVRC